MKFRPSAYGADLQRDARAWAVQPTYAPGSTYGAYGYGCGCPPGCGCAPPPVSTYGNGDVATSIATGLTSLVSTFGPMIGQKKRAAQAAAQSEAELRAAQAQADLEARRQNTLIYGAIGSVAVIAALALAVRFSR